MNSLNKSLPIASLAACCAILTFARGTQGAPIAVTYNAVGEQLLANSSIWPGGDAFDEEFQLLNNTGESWTDFHFRVAFTPGSGLGGTFGFIDAPVGGHDGTAYEGPGTYTVGPFGQELNVDNINVAPGATYIFTLDTDAFELIGDYDVFGLPSISGTTPAQTPDGGSSLALITLAILTLAFRRR